MGAPIDDAHGLAWIGHVYDAQIALGTGGFGKGYGEVGIPVVTALAHRQLVHSALGAARRQEAELDRICRVRDVPNRQPSRACAVHAAPLNAREEHATREAW